MDLYADLNECPKGGEEVRTSPEKYKNIGFLSNSGPDPLKNHKATKQAFNVWPSSGRQPNATYIHFDPLSLHKKKRNKRKKRTLSEFDPLRQNFLDLRMSLHCLRIRVECTNNGDWSALNV